MTRGEKVIAFVERYCRVPDGAKVGQPLRLLDFQKRWILDVYDNPAGTTRAYLSIGRKNGKGLALDTPVPTPRGWTTMGALKAGDEVFGADGKPTRVEFVSDVHRGLRCWRLTFSDGSSVVADEQHRWMTRHAYRPWANGRRNGSGNGGRWRQEVVTTPQIAASVMRPRADGGVESNHKIAAAPALTSAPVSLPIDPYVLGAWLGDGTSSSATFTCGDEDIPHMVQRLSAGLQGAVRVSRYGARASTIRTPGLGLQKALRAAGVLGNKHIPESYFAAGTAQRWALLQGLMDTDGTVTRCAGQTTARCSFTGTNENLCRGVWRLARTLGLKATLRQRDAKLNGEVVGMAYHVDFAASRDEPVFSLSRKQSFLPERLGARSRTITIVACEEVESVPTVCIKVAAADSLFLVGHGCIPTHNTALIACIVLAHLVGPEARQNSQIISGARSRDQAALVFNLAEKMVNLNPDLAAIIRIVPSGKRLIGLQMGTEYRAISAEAGTAHGLSPVVAILDEVGQVKGRYDPFVEAIETAQGAHADPLLVAISTQAATDGDLFSVWLDDARASADPRTVCHLYAAPAGCELDDREAWRAANPAMGEFRSVRDLEDFAARAARQPSAENSFRWLFLNQRVEASSPFIGRSLWASCAEAPAPLAGMPVYGGLDLSSVQDLTALVLIGQAFNEWHVHPRFWLPAQGLRDKSLRDRETYDDWARDGYLEATPGPAISYEYVAHRMREVFDTCDVRAIAFDRWGWPQFRPWLERAGFDEAELERFVPFGQGFASMSPAMRELETAILEGRVRHGMHPVLSMCAANAVVRADPAGNRKLDKAKSSGRIDGMVALVMAAGAMPTEPEVAVQNILTSEKILQRGWVF